MFESHGKKKFHAQWFQHGSQIMLQEIAHPQGLFLIEECDDLYLTCISQKCNLQTLGPDEDEPYAESVQDDNNFFTRLSQYTHSFEDLTAYCLLFSLFWDPYNSIFLDMSVSDYTSALKHCKRWQPCLSCGRKAIKKKQAQWAIGPDGGISRLGVTYHAHDFVYLRPSDGSFQYNVAQITEMIFDRNGRCKMVGVRYYGRYDDVLRRQNDDDQYKKMDNVWDSYWSCCLPYLLWFYNSAASSGPKRSNKLTPMRSKAKYLWWPSVMQGIITSGLNILTTTTLIGMLRPSMRNWKTSSRNFLYVVLSPAVWSALRSDKTTCIDGSSCWSRMGHFTA